MMNPKNLIIRQLMKSEIPALSKLATDTYIETFGHGFTKKQLNQLIKESRSIEYFEKFFDDDTIFGAFVETEMVGYVQFGIICRPFKMAAAKDREFRRLYVASDYQNQGIGKALLEQALAHPVLKNAAKIYLDVWEKNPVAIKLYQKYDFKIVDKIRWEQDGQFLSNDLVMVRKQS